MEESKLIQEVTYHKGLPFKNSNKKEEVVEIKTITQFQYDERKTIAENRIKIIDEYIKFIGDIIDSKEGDTFRLKSGFHTVVKKTKTGHIDFDVYEILHNVEDENIEIKGTWQGRVRKTNDELESSISVAFTENTRMHRELLQLEKLAIVEEEPIVELEEVKNEEFNTDN